MMDVAEEEGLSIEPKVLETAIGIPVVPMSAAKGQGVAELMETIVQFRENKLPYHPQKPSILPAHQKVLDEVMALLNGLSMEGLPLRWVGIKLLEGDEEITRKAKALVRPEVWQKVERILYTHEDAILDIAGARYTWIARMLRAAVFDPPISHGRLTARLDRVLTHPFWGTLVMLLLLGGVFWLTYSVGSPAPDLAGRPGEQAWPTTCGTGSASPRNGRSNSSPGASWAAWEWCLRSCPCWRFFTPCSGFWRTRATCPESLSWPTGGCTALGLHGKSFLPFLLGFGCNVPAILGSRIVESPKARLLTLLLIPLIPCAARTAVVTFLAPVLFGPLGGAGLGGVAGGQPPAAGAGWIRPAPFRLPQRARPLHHGTAPVSCPQRPGRSPCSSGTTSWVSSRKPGG